MSPFRKGQRPRRPKRPQKKVLFALNKPFRVLCQFRDEQSRATLANFVTEANIYAAGRLDFDSEGLLLLSGHGPLIQAITAPSAKLTKRYWAQVDGEIDDEALRQLERGVELKDGVTAPATADLIEEPAGLWPRDPPIRERKNSPTSWIDLGITEGRNRQVRRMTAAVGFPTLRLIRHRIGDWALDGMAPGDVRRLDFPEAWITSRRSRSPR